MPKPELAMASQRRAIRSVIEKPDNNWYRLMTSLWPDIDPDVRKTVFENFIVHSAVIGYHRQNKNKEKIRLQYPVGDTDGPQSAF